MADIVDLGNFQTKMSSWHAALDNHLFALVDMGSNGIRFSISDLSPPQSRLLNCLYSERAGISLFDALNSGTSAGPLVFPQETIAQVSKTLARFKFIADEYGVPFDNISVFATEAMRRAENALVMLESIKSASGLDVRILAPEVETLFGSMGARSGFSEAKGLFLDLGGGSVQMTYVDSALENYEIEAAQSGESMPFGAARLIKVLEAGGVEAQDTARDDLGSRMTEVFSRLKGKFPSLAEATSENLDIFLCGGGFRGYGSLLMHNDDIQPYPIAAIGSYTVSGGFFKKTDEMRRVNQDYQGKIFGMSKRRRQQLPATATVVEALIRAVPNIRSVTFCAGGNREGALLLKLPRDDRDCQPLSLLHDPGESPSPDATESIIRSIKSTLPPNGGTGEPTNIFSLGLGHLFVERIWSRQGESEAANAAYELHHALTHHPSAAGLTHLARAVLGLTLCARWGSSLSLVDQQLFQNVRRLAYRSSPEAVFWAEYIGTVAAVIALVCPVQPRDPGRLDDSIKFLAETSSANGKSVISLRVDILPGALKGVDPQDIWSEFQTLQKLGDEYRLAKVNIDVRLSSP